MRRDVAQHVAVGQVDRCRRRAAEIHGAIGDGVEHGLDVRRRTRNGAQDFADGGLLLEAFLGLVEQPHVVDGDGGLVARTSRPALPACRVNARGSIRHRTMAPIARSFAHQRHREHRTIAEAPLHLARRPGIRCPTSGTRSSRWIVVRSMTARPVTSRASAARHVTPLLRSVDVFPMPRPDAARRHRPAQTRDCAASQSFSARSATASSTGCTSSGELEITRRISLMAVCCSRPSFVSLNRRTLSMAIAAWRAKVSTTVTWSGANGLRLAPVEEDGAVGTAFADQRHRQHRPTAECARRSAAASGNSDVAAAERRPRSGSSCGRRSARPVTECSRQRHRYQVLRRAPSTANRSARGTQHRRHRPEDTRVRCLAR